MHLIHKIHHNYIIVADNKSETGYSKIEIHGKSAIDGSYWFNSNNKTLDITRLEDSNGTQVILATFLNP